MKKELPKIFVNPINKDIKNQRDLFYGKQNETRNALSRNDIIIKINKLLSSRNYIYKKKLELETKNGIKIKEIIGKTNNFLLTIDNEKIYYDDIINVKEC